MRNLSKILKINQPFFYLFLASIFFALALEPFGYALSGFGCILFLILFSNHLRMARSWRMAILATVLFSFLVTLTSFHWIWNAIRNISGQGLFISSFLYLLYALISFYKVGVVFLGTVCISKFRNFKETPFVLMVLPALFLISDWICPMVFPVKWGDLFRNQLIWRQTARFGCEVLGFVSVFSSALIYILLLRYKEGFRIYFTCLTPLMVLISLNLIFLSQEIPTQNIVHLALVQPNIAYAKREDAENQIFMTNTMQSVYDLGLESIRKAPTQLDLLIFPESAIPFLGTLKSERPESTYSKSFDELITNLAKMGNQSIAFNELVYENGSRNSFTVFNAQTLQHNRKFKHHLLPFGEYLPGEAYVSALRSLFPEASNHVPGELEDSHEFRTSLGINVRFTPFICYEILYAQWIRELVLHSPSEFMINLTNDSWFESQTEAEQHAGAGKLRSIEMGRPLIRVALNGITTAYDPWGREMMNQIPLNTKSIAYLDLPTVSESVTTPYLVWGPYPWRIGSILLLCIVSLVNPKHCKDQS